MCEELQEQTYAFERDADGKISYTFQNTSGGAHYAQHLWSSPQRQCRYAYAVDTLDTTVCKNTEYSTVDEDCLDAVKYEQGFRSGDRNKQSKKEYYLQNVGWGV